LQEIKWLYFVPVFKYEITSFDEPVSVSEVYNPYENGLKRQHNNWREGFPRN
jgi:hypothetical protein